LRVLIITFDPPENTGGIEGRANNYTKQLIALGHFVEVISFSPEGKYTKEELYGVTLWRFPASSRRAIKSLGKTSKEISRNKIDAVFLLSGALTFYGVLLLLRAKLKGINTLIFFYGKDILTAKASFLSAMALWISPRLAEGIATNSHYTAGLLPKKYERRAKILYPSVDPSIVDQVPVEAPKKTGKVLLFVGRLVKRKGVDDLLRAFHSLQELDTLVDIVGDGPELNSLQSLSKELGVSDRVKFWGKLSGGALYERYANCYLFVMPSKRTKTDVEGFGTVFLEAGLFGKPCVGTRSGGIPEAILDGETGLLVPEEKNGLLSEALLALLKDPSRAKTMGEIARKRVLSSFTWEESTKLLISFLSDPKM